MPANTADLINTKVKTVVQRIARDMKAVEDKVAKSPYQMWVAQGNQGTELDFLHWLRGNQNAAAGVKLWVRPEVANIVDPVLGFSLDKYDIPFSEITNTKHTASNRAELLSDGTLQLKQNADWRNDRLILTRNARVTEFELERQGVWVIVGSGTTEHQHLAIQLASYTVAHDTITANMVLDNFNSGVLWNATQAVNKRHTSPVVPRHALVRVVQAEDKRSCDIYFKPRDSEEWTHFFHFDNPTWGNHTYSYDVVGVISGISGRETTGVNNTRIVVSHLKRYESAEKYAVLVVMGQSNAVGYDESPVVASDYPEHPRIRQLGIDGVNNLKVIPLQHYAESWQDMRGFTNPANPHLKGTKGIHYHLAKSLLDRIPPDYKLLVITSAYGGTGYGLGSNGTYDAVNMKPVGSSLRWSNTSPYYLALRDRLKMILDRNDSNALLGVVYIQGEADTNPTTWQVGYQGVFDSFRSYIRSNYANRTLGDNYWYFVESSKHWKNQSAYRSVLGHARRMEVATHSYVEIDLNAPTNAVNGTGRTSSVRDSHFGNNAFRDVVAPAVLAKMVEVNGA